MSYEILIPTLGFAAVGFVVTLAAWHVLQWCNGHLPWLGRAARAASDPGPRPAPEKAAAPVEPAPTAPPPPRDAALSGLERIERSLAVMAEAQVTLVTAAHRQEAASEQGGDGSPPGLATQELQDILGDVRKRLAEPAAAEQVMQEVRDALAGLPEMIAAQLAARKEEEESRLQRLSSQISAALSDQAATLEKGITQKLADALPRLDQKADLNARLSAQTDVAKRQAAVSARIERQLSALSYRIGTDADSPPAPQTTRDDQAKDAAQPPRQGASEDVSPPVTLRPWLRPARPAPAATSEPESPPRPRSAPAFDPTASTDGEPPTRIHWPREQQS
ncbi:hypothetical protein [Oceanibium sediminis]|uniref:hypothetical protein n=1 Tax=Oceanibium sediminis TaxID=2026339 RepID=UPI000DD4466B|nr:hypothetical protein [Oceanibium sediminis]